MCEAWAIYIAIKEISSLDEAKYLICSDSKVTLEELKCKSNKNTIINYIKNELHHILKNNSNTDIRFIWTPAHAGIEGNEFVHVKAKNATLNGTLQNTPVYHEDIKKYLKLKSNNNWQQIWANRVNIDYFKLKKYFFKKSVNRFFIRREQIKLTRIKIGHTKLTHIHLMKKEDYPVV